MLTLPQPYLLFLGDITEAPYAKTAFGLRDWAPERCIGEYALPGATVTTGLPRLAPAEAYQRGARALVIGIASVGGAIVPSWMPALIEAMEAGLDLVSGMHTRLSEDAEIRHAAERLGRRLIDVRQPPRNIPVGTGRKRTGKRILTVGTDCAVGKKYAALALTGALKRQGLQAEFRATGQTGILIAGAGMPMDAVVSDFLSGAAEMLTPDAPEDHWDVVEGQGSLFHPSYAGVSLGLLHGTQPDVLVVCHDIGRETMLGMPHYRVPSVEDTIELNLMLARRTNPRVKCGGVALNTSRLTEENAKALMADYSARLRLPVADPIRGGPALAALAAACVAG